MGAYRIAFIIGFAWTIVLQVDGQPIHYSERKASRQPVPYNSGYHVDTSYDTNHGSPSGETRIITLPQTNLKPSRQPVPFSGKTETSSSYAFPDQKPHRQPVPKADRWAEQHTSDPRNQTFVASVRREKSQFKRRPSRQPVPSAPSVPNESSLKDKSIKPVPKIPSVPAGNQIAKTSQSASVIPLWKQAPETPWQPDIGGYQPYSLSYNSRPNNHLSWNPIVNVARQYQRKQQGLSQYGTGNPLNIWGLSGRQINGNYMYREMVPADNYAGNAYDGHLSSFGLVDYNGPCRRLCTMYCSLGYDVDIKGCPACNCQRPAASFACPRRYCNQHCPYGQEKDVFGCSTCTCKSFSGMLIEYIRSLPYDPGILFSE
ncbi:uncharacterized protein [Haliotis cracherodii]|uniref:uncharacterized protein n=1 Tax=Haliotis cracherodii TaxID=6455 RepID=UPI0039E9825E